MISSKEGREKIGRIFEETEEGREEDQLQAEGLGIFEAKVLGRTHSDYPLRKVRDGTSAGKGFTIKASLCGKISTDGNGRVSFGRDFRLG